MGTLSGKDLGTVSLIEPLERNAFVTKRIATLGSYPQNMLASDHAWRIQGFLSSLTKTKIQDLRFLRDTGLVCLLQITDVTPNIVAWGKVAGLRRIFEEGQADIMDYEIDFVEVPAIGLMTIRNATTDDCFINDLVNLYHQRYLYPYWTRCNLNYATDRTYLEWEFKLENRSDATKVITVEVQTVFNVNKFKLYYYDSVYLDVGDWGGNDDWGDTRNFNDGHSHNVTVDKGVRGETKSGMVISRSLGALDRIIFKVDGVVASELTTALKIRMELLTGQAYYEQDSWVDGGVLR